jgi:hypothetical protein
VEVSKKEIQEGLEATKKQGGEAGIQSVELFADHGKWKAWAWRSAPFRDSPRRRIWKVVDVSISYISENTSEADRFIPILVGNRDGVSKKWAAIGEQAGKYAYAEHGEDWKKDKKGAKIQNWPNSFYENDTKLMPFSNNSNTFARFLIRAVGLPLREPSGSHPGAPFPGAVEPTPGMPNQVFAAEKPFSVDLPEKEWPPKPKKPPY